MLSLPYIPWLESRHKRLAIGTQRGVPTSFALIALLATLSLGASLAISPLVVLGSEARELESNGVEFGDLLKDRVNRREHGHRRCMLVPTQWQSRRRHGRPGGLSAHLRFRPELIGSGIRILC